MWFWNRFEILGILLKIFIFIGAFCFFDKVFFLCKFRQKEYFWNFSYLYFKLLQNYNQCVNIPKTVSEISTMGESIQIKKVHSVYITLWTLHLRKEGDSNPRYRYQYDSLANCWFQPLTHLSICADKSSAFYRFCKLLTWFFSFFHVHPWILSRYQLFSLRGWKFPHLLP